MAMNRIALAGFDRTLLVDRFADDVHDTTQRLRSDRHRNWRAGVGDFLAADHAIGDVHGDAADGALAQFLRHFQHQRAVFDLAGERIQDERQFAVELHVHDRPEDLGHATDDVACHVSGIPLVRRSGGFCECEIKRLLRRR